jgi:hypothetical protein
MKGERTMKQYVEISGYTQTAAQWAARCRAALRKAGPVYASWADYISGAMEEMNEIAEGKKGRYYNNHKADDERNFDEICAASADSYQIYYKSHDPEYPGLYNLIVEYDGEHGYMYCVDGMAQEKAAAR